MKEMNELSKDICVQALKNLMSKANIGNYFNDNDVFILAKLINEWDDLKNNITNKG